MACDAYGFRHNPVKKGYARIISAMERRQVDILIGTQMVTKGLDFEKVSLWAS